MNIPPIKVQLVHLAGPLNGEIQEYCQTVVTFGRHPECEVVFPNDYAAISRRHAEIRREGNRFKLIDQSSNGTLVNGKQQKDTYLKNGDVLLIGGKEGAKVSFLSKEISPEEAAALAPARVEEDKWESAQKPIDSKPQPVEIPPSEQRPQPRPIPSVTKTFTIQYGTTLTSFKKLPISLGSSSDCDCTLQHPSLLDHHAEFFFRENQYWVKDLTGRGLITVNMQTVKSESPLMPDGYLDLTPKGPKFMFLGEGRLAEIDVKKNEKNEEQVKTSVKSAKPSKNVELLKPKSLLAELYNKKEILLWIIATVLGICLIMAFLFML